VADIGSEARAQLDASMPPTWSRGNPVDIVGDADASRYSAALEPLLSDPESDALLVLNVHTAGAPTNATAEAVADVVRKGRGKWLRMKPVFAAWIGVGDSVSEIFANADIPHYATEAEAVRGFMHLVEYGEAHRALMETPPSLPTDFAPDAAAARRVVQAAIAEGRRWLDPLEIAQVFAAYEVPLAPVKLARSADEAVEAAAPWLAEGTAAAIKILSPDIIHKSDVGGVRLDLRDEKAVWEATNRMLARVRAAKPDARITGVTVHPTIVRPHARELIAGIADDPTFGPIIVFGCGGTAVEIVADKALALPPLDIRLAHELIERTRVARLLGAYRDVAAADKEEIALLLVKLAQLAADVPEIRDLDVNPVLADIAGMVALDARVAIAPSEPKFKGVGHPRFSIRPYPKEWERQLTLLDGSTVFARPVRPEDEALFRRFFEKVNQDDLRLRFFAPVKEISHTFIARLTQLDFARAMAFAALDAQGELLGVVRLHADANYETGEYAILLRSDLKGRGLGWKLMELIINYARSEGLKRIEGQVLRENTVMLAMCQELGFSIEADPSDTGIRIAVLALH
jgi:acetyltransferase